MSKTAQCETQCGEDTNYWRKKMRNLFNRIDVGGRGRLRKEDLMGVAERFIEIAELSQEESDKLRSLFDSGVWDNFFQPSGDGGDESAACTADIMIANIEKQGKDSFLEVATYLFGRYFDAVDKDQDGRIRLPEFARYFYIIGTAQKYAEPAFKALDTDKDGVLGREEFVKAGHDYIGLDKESYPSDDMFGPFDH